MFGLLPRSCTYPLALDCAHLQRNFCSSRPYQLYVFCPFLFVLGSPDGRGSAVSLSLRLQMRPVWLCVTCVSLQRQVFSLGRWRLIS